MPPSRHKIRVTEGIRDPSLTSLFLSRALFNTFNTAIIPSEPQVTHVTALLRTPQCLPWLLAAPGDVAELSLRLKALLLTWPHHPSDLHSLLLSHWTPAVGSRYRMDRHFSHQRENHPIN